MGASRSGVSRRAGPAAWARTIGRAGSTARLTRFNETNIEEIFQSGLHEYILAFLSENNALASAIHDQYLV